MFSYPFIFSPCNLSNPPPNIAQHISGDPVDSILTDDQIRVGSGIDWLNITDHNDLTRRHIVTRVCLFDWQLVIERLLFVSML